MTTMNATPTMRRPNRPPEVLAEQAEARAMIAELGRILRRIGRYDLSALARRCQDEGVSITRCTLIRWFNGQAAPYTIDRVELVARAAGIDAAYLIGCHR